MQVADRTLMLQADVEETIHQTPTGDARSLSA